MTFAPNGGKVDILDNFVSFKGEVEVDFSGEGGVTLSDTGADASVFGRSSGVKIRVILHCVLVG